MTTTTTTTTTSPPRRRGRPTGSKNKPKTPAPTTTATASKKPRASKRTASKRNGAAASDDASELNALFELAERQQRVAFLRERLGEMRERQAALQRTAAATTTIDGAELVDWLHAQGAQRAVAIDVREKCWWSSAVVVCTAQSAAHASAVARDLVRLLKQRQLFIAGGVDGVDNGEWAIVDVGGDTKITVHVFGDDDVRAFYDLEAMWAERPSIAELVRSEEAEEEEEADDDYNGGGGGGGGTRTDRW